MTLLVANLSITVLVVILALAIAGLVLSADKFVEGAAALAENWGVSPLAIGLTVVAFGTSAPEIIVSATAASKGASELAIGNALGSNLANFCLVLGVTACILVIPVSQSTVRKEVSWMLVVTLLVGAVLFDGFLGRWETLALALLVIPFLWVTFRGSAAASDGPIEITPEIHHLSTGRSLAFAVGGLVALIISANFLVSSASEVAMRAGVSSVVIGMTVVAIGTSLPELAASVASALKGKSDIALGNVLGSNIFNLLIVLPVAGIVAPSDIGATDFARDYGLLAVVTLVFSMACFIGTYQGKTFRLNKFHGAAFLVVYASYYLWLFLSVPNHH